MTKYQTHHPCICCNTVEVDRCYHHLKTRKAHPAFVDEPWNLIPVCVGHHNEIHLKGLNHMANKYHQVQNWLRAMNWEWDSYSRKWLPPIILDE